MKKLVPLFFCAFIYASLALAHSWFPFECCGNGDCKEIIYWATEQDKWVIKTKDLTVIVPTTFPIRPSQDNKKYLCATKAHVYCIFSLAEI